MILDLHDCAGIDEKTLNAINELTNMLKAAGTDRLADLIMTAMTFQLQTEITFAGKDDVASVNDFWLEILGRVMILIKEQDSRGTFTERLH